MARSTPGTLASFLVVCLFAATASAAPIVGVGLFSFEANTPTGDTFSIINLTGAGALPPDYPITTLLTFSIASLTAIESGGKTLSLGPSAFFADASGNLTCTAAGDAGSGGCNFAAYSLTSAVITGTLFPTVGLDGQPAGSSGVLGHFSATLTPTCNIGSLTAGCDLVSLDAELVPVSTPVPEPSTALQLATGVFAAAVRFRHARLRPFSKNLR